MTSANHLLDFDREMRRAARLLDGTRSGNLNVDSDVSVASWTRPLNSNEGSLEVLSATPGSLHYALLAYGNLESIILNAPLQMVMTVEWLWDRRPNRRGAKRNAAPPVDPATILESTIDKVLRFAENNPGLDTRFAAHIDAAGALDIDFGAIGQVPPFPRGAEDDTTMLQYYRDRDDEMGIGSTE